MNKLLSVATILFCSLFMNWSSEVSKESYGSSATQQPVIMDILDEDFQQILKIERSTTELQIKKIREILDFSGVNVGLEYNRDSNGEINELEIVTLMARCSSTNFKNGVVIIRESGNVDCGIGENVGD